MKVSLLKQTSFLVLLAFVAQIFLSEDAFAESRRKKNRTTPIGTTTTSYINTGTSTTTSTGTSTTTSTGTGTTTTTTSTSSSASGGGGGGTSSATGGSGSTSGTTSSGTTPVTTTTSSSTTTTTTVPTVDVSVLDTSNPTLDQQGELQAIFDKAAQTGGKVVLPAGTFRHSGLLYARGIDVSGAGPSTVLVGTTRNLSSIILTGTGGKLHDLKLSYASTTRSGSDYSAQVLVKDASTFEVYNLTIQGGDSVGVFLSNAHNGSVYGNTINNTLANSIHMTNGTTYIKVHDNTTRYSGDDGVAVVSYERNGVKSGNIEVYKNNILDSIGSRTLTVVGGYNVNIHDNYSRCTPNHGAIYIASESSFQTYGVSNITVQNNILDGCSNWNFGGIMVYTNFRANDHVTIKGNTVNSPPIYGIWIYGKDTSYVTITGNTVKNAGIKPIVVDPTIPMNMVTQSNNAI